MNRWAGTLGAVGAVLLIASCDRNVNINFNGESDPFSRRVPVEIEDDTTQMASAEPEAFPEDAVGGGSTDAAARPERGDVDDLIPVRPTPARAADPEETRPRPARQTQPAPRRAAPPVREEPRPLPAAPPVREEPRPLPAAPPVREEPRPQLPAAPPIREEPRQPEVRLPRDEQPPPTSAPATENARITIQTDPPGARAVLRETDGSASYTIDTTPGTVAVFPGIYEWSVEREGYMAARGPTLIAVAANESVERAVTLTADAVEERFEAADRAYEGGDCAAAMGEWASIERPADMSASAGEEYIKSRFRLAACLGGQQDIQDQIEVLREIIYFRPQQYEAYLTLGARLCEVGDFQAGKDVLLDIRGNVATNIPADRKLPVLALATYHGGICSHLQYEEDGVRSRLGSAANDFISFVSTAESLLAQSRWRAEDRRDLAAALADARQRLDSIRSR